MPTIRCRFKTDAVVRGDHGFEVQALAVDPGDNGNHENRNEFWEGVPTGTLYLKTDAFSSLDLFPYDGEFWVDITPIEKGEADGA